MSKNVLCLLAASLFTSYSLTTPAAEPASCQTVRMAEVGWADISATTGLASTLLKNLEFSLAMENQIMGAILDDKEQPEAAATAWLKANPEVLEQWLAGVTTYDGAQALPAVRGSLGL